jgi:prepilin-type N-terminal cleavage/methylation domain-containing protein
MRRLTPSHRLTRICTDQRGFTLIELMVSTMLIIVGLMGVVTLIDAAAATTLVTKQRQTGTSIGREVVESSRAVAYPRLTAGSLEADLQARSSLADSNAQDSSWTVRRGPTSYTVSTSVCSVDDPKDGIGDHSSPDGTNTSAAFCSSPTPTNPADDNPDDYKRVVADISWGPADARRSNRQASLIANPGSAAGPQITSLSRSPTDDPIVDDGQLTIDFSAVTSTPAATVRYTVDGAVRRIAVPPTGGRDSSFDWLIRDDATGQYVVDGTYVVGAQAFDARGVPGAVRSLPVKLNRRRPVRPNGFTGGWNATRSIADFDWLASDEGDIIGYRLYRVNADGTSSEVCTTESVRDTTCSDPSPPQDAPSIDYFLVARDRSPDTEAERDGTPSALLTVTRTSNRPNPPATVTATSTEGGVKLDWTPPSAPAGYPGDAIRFYRIYRDEQAFEDRYDRTGSGSETTYTDSDPGDVARTYSITAVDENYSESAPVGPVGAP